MSESKRFTHIKSHGIGASLSPVNKLLLTLSFLRQFSSVGKLGATPGQWLHGELRASLSSGVQTSAPKLSSTQRPRPQTPPVPSAAPQPTAPALGPLSSVASARSDLPTRPGTPPLPCAAPQPSPRTGWASAGPAMPAPLASLASHGARERMRTPPLPSEVVVIDDDDDDDDVVDVTERIPASSRSPAAAQSSLGGRLRPTTASASAASKRAPQTTSTDPHAGPASLSKPPAFGPAGAPSLMIVYPTVDNVRESLEGYAAGGALPNASA
jgi:hypothetical protein